MTDSDLVYSVLVITQQPNPDYLRALTPHFALRTGDWSQVGMLLKQETADLLIIDQVLEDAQLGDLLTSLPHHPAFGRIPTLLLTQAQPDEALYLRCTFLGIDDVLHKPVLPSHLLLKARSLAERVCLGRQLNQQSQYLERLVEHSHREAEMASYLFYNNLLDQVSDHLLGFNRYIHSSSDFCGDLVLAKSSPSGSTFVLHADAMGHGLSATVTLLPLVDIFHSMVDKGYALPMIVREMNRKLNYKLPPDRFVAASLIEVDLLHDQVSLWNGGMPPVHLLSEQGQIEASYPSRFMALGILSNADFDSAVERFPLPKQGGIFGCSDGLLEQLNAQGESFGAQRLYQQLAGCSRHSMMSSLVADLKEFSGLPHFDDDVSLFYLHFGELAHFVQQQQELDQQTHQRQRIDPFVWSLTLQGRQIGDQELPALCNDMLQGFGLNQPFCQRAFTVISELVNNAIDHGILGLSSSLKNDLDGFSHYYIQRLEGLNQLTAQDQLRLSLAWVRDQNQAYLEIEVEQSGAGFDAERVLSQPQDALSGRGLQLVKSLTSQLTFEQGGRKACARVG